MKLKFKGIYNNTETLLAKEHSKNAIKMKELDLKQMSVYFNIGYIVMAIILLIIFKIRANNSFNAIGAFLLWIITMIPHEIIHASCFKEEVYFYIYPKTGLFIYGNEIMSKKRYIFMTLLPNLIFGFLPYIVFLFFPQYTILGSLGVLTISSGIGDYYNIYNAITQVPNGGKIYMYELETHWYMTEDENNK